MIPPAKRGGRRREVNVREVLNAIFYVLSTGCQWQALPKDLPPKSTTHSYFMLWDWDGTLERVHHALYSVDASDSSYFAVRGMLAKTVTEAARFVLERGVIEEGAPVLVRFIAQVASRFGVVVTQKFAAQALPVVGALGGASELLCLSSIFKRSLKAISRCADSKEPTARTSGGWNMSA
jgi:transposase